jgi:flagellar hook protein FlgE
MGLYDAMNASVTGMAAQSNYLANIGQNIANADTVGYKEADTEFSTLVDQSAVGQTSAGGVTTETRLDVAQQGTLESTTSSTDLAVSGNGFFVVSNASGQEFLTRAGSFVPDASGNLINAGGYYLMGYSTAKGTPTMASNSLTGMQVVNINTAGLSATATTSGTLTGNLPATDTAVAAANLPSTNSASAAYDEKTSMVMYGNLGVSETVDLYYTQTTTPGVWDVAAYNAADASTTSTTGFPYSSGPLASGTMTFNATTGDFSTGTGAISTGGAMTIPVPNGSNMLLNMSGMTQLAGSFAVSTSAVNGNAAASVSSVTIGTNGNLSYQLTNGSTVSAYDIPLANVASPDNLLPVSGNAYSANILSGQPSVGTAGTAGLGTIQSSELEESTVDIATELTNMIVAQRGYEANSQVFKAGADLLSNLIQMNLT